MVNGGAWYTLPTSQPPWPPLHDLSPSIGLVGVGPPLPTPVPCHPLVLEVEAWVGLGLVFLILASFGFSPEALVLFFPAFSSMMVWSLTSTSNLGRGALFHSDFLFSTKSAVHVSIWIPSDTCLSKADLCLASRFMWNCCITPLCVSTQWAHRTLSSSLAVSGL